MAVSCNVATQAWLRISKGTTWQCIRVVTIIDLQISDTMICKPVLDAGMLYFTNQDKLVQSDSSVYKMCILHLVVLPLWLSQLCLLSSLYLNWRTETSAHKPNKLHHQIYIMRDYLTSTTTQKLKYWEHMEGIFKEQIYRNKRNNKYLIFT